MTDHQHSVHHDALKHHGFETVKTAHWNDTATALCEAALARGEVRLAHGGAIVANTSQHTGRASEDKFFVDEPSSTNALCWGKVNQPIAPAHFDALHARIRDYLKGREIFIQDCYCGADPNLRLPVRIITQTAWHVCQ